MGDGDTGPNTGGMGAYSPAPVVTREVEEQVMREMVLPTVAGLAAEGCPFVGVLFAGIMARPNPVKSRAMPRTLAHACAPPLPKCRRSV